MNWRGGKESPRRGASRISWAVGPRTSGTTISRGHSCGGVKASGRTRHERVAALGHNGEPILSQRHKARLETSFSAPKMALRLVEIPSPGPIPDSFAVFAP